MGFPGELTLLSRATATFCLRAGDPYADGRHVHNHPNAAAALGAPVKFAARAEHRRHPPADGTVLSGLVPLVAEVGLRYTLRTGSRYLPSCASPVTRVTPSVRAWASRRRSKGSLCSGGRASTFTACSLVIGELGVSVVEQSPA